MKATKLQRLERLAALTRLATALAQAQAKGTCFEIDARRQNLDPWPIHGQRDGGSSSRSQFSKQTVI